jgi:addiction module RelB/DinJ family antitoxin
MWPRDCEKIGRQNSLCVDRLILGYILWFMQTTVIFKVDKKLKEAAQKTAKKMGIPFSAAMNRLMANFVDSKEITFSAQEYNPTPYLRRILKQGEKNLAEGKVKYYGSIEEMRADLEK